MLSSHCDKDFVTFIQTFHSGLKEVFNNRECNLLKRRKQFQEKIAKERALLDEIQLKITTVGKLVKKRIEIFDDLDFRLCGLFGLRNDVGTLLGGLGDIVDDPKSWTQKTMLQYLRVIEDLICVESITLPVLDSTNNSAKCFNSVADNLDDITKDISSEFTSTNQLHEQEQEIQNQITCCDSLVQEIIKITNSGIDIEGKQDMIKETEAASSMLTKNIPKLFSRQLKPLQSIPPIIDSKYEDPYEEENELLDKVLHTNSENVFFVYQLTYRYFMTSKELMTYLCTRFCVTPPDIESLDLQAVKKEQESVLEFLLSWVRNFYIPDFHETMETNVGNFLSLIATPAGHEKASQIIQEAMKQRIQDISNPQIPKLWSIVTAKSQQLNRTNLLAVRPKQYAEQLAIYEHRLYANIQHHEFIGQKWGRNNPRRYLDTPNILAYTEHYNQASNWYISHILDIPTPTERAETISKLIHIMLFSFQFNNFLGTFEILFALNSTGIYRLSNTWNLVPEDKRRILWIFSKFTASGFRLYKAEFSKVTGPAIPYLGTFLTDITFIEDGNATHGKDKRINFHFKCLKIHSTIEKALQFQKEEFQFEPDELLLAHIHKEFTTCPRLNEDEIYDKSVCLEKSGPSAAFRFPHIEDEQILAEIHSYNSVEVFRTFSGSARSKRSATLQKIGATDFLQAKTGLRMRKKKTIDISGFSSPRGSSDILLLRNSLSDDLIAESDNQEIIVHMRMFGSGIPLSTRSHKGTRQQYFLANTLIEWLSKNLSDSSRFRAIEIAQRLFDDGYIVGLDTDEAAKIWINKPMLKLKFKENYSMMDVMGSRNMFGSSTSSIDATEENEDSTEESDVFSEDSEISTNFSESEIVSASNTWNDVDLEELANRMKHPKSGVKIKTQKWLLKRFPNCFVGEQGVTWLCHHLDITDRKEAVSVGLRMQEYGLFHHVTNDHPFQDKYLFFRFNGT